MYKIQGSFTNRNRVIGYYNVAEKKMRYIVAPSSDDLQRRIFFQKREMIFEVQGS